MAPSTHHSNSALFARVDDSGVAQAATNNSKLTPTLIIGVAAAAAIFGAICIWLLVRHIRKKASAKREEGRGAAFLNVRGIVEEKGGSGLAVKGNLFSRDKMTDNVIMPEKVILRPDASRNEIIEHYSASGKLPRPFAPFMAGGDSLQLPAAAADKSEKRNSTASWISMGRHSFFSSRDSVRSSIASFGGSEDGDKRKIKQIFTPVLPDELVISIGERLTVVNSFDDGWCIVGRDSVFKPGEIELGAIPAWCFMKPMQGLRAERPLRTTSLGVTITLDAPAGPRENVVSWSNF